MQTVQTMDRHSEKGFTLVELAVVMIIIGLLIGGILKGQELIANAEVAATVSGIKSIDGATSTFQDKYDDLPGDIQNVGNRLPNCAGACNINGNGDSRLTGNAPLAAPAGEQQRFFLHLNAANLLGGLSGAGGAAAWGNQYPEAEVGGGFHAAYHGGGAVGAGAPPVGHYLSLVFTPGGAGANNAITPNQAQRIDSKLDDGVPNTGDVVSNGGCVAANIYDEDNDAAICDLVVRFQN